MWIALIATFTFFTGYFGSVGITEFRRAWRTERQDDIAAAMLRLGTAMWCLYVAVWLLAQRLL